LEIFAKALKRSFTLEVNLQAFGCCANKLVIHLADSAESMVQPLSVVLQNQSVKNSNNGP
jgi:hypothetical protein